MKQLSMTWSASFKEFKKIHTLAFCGIMCALALVISRFTTINIGQYIRISIAELPNRAVEFLFGPAIGMFFGGMLDILKYLINPTGPFFPGFTLTAALTGVIFGCILYQKKPTLKRIFAAELTVKLFLSVGLNSLWLNILYGKALMAILPARIVTNAIMLPIDTAMYYFCLKFIDRRLKQYLR